MVITPREFQFTAVLQIGGDAPGGNGKHVEEPF
jgi:hypothetical protein